MNPRVHSTWMWNLGLAIGLLTGWFGHKYQPDWGWTLAILVTGCILGAVWAVVKDAIASEARSNT